MLTDKTICLEDHFDTLSTEDSQDIWNRRQKTDKRQRSQSMDRDTKKTKSSHNSNKDKDKDKSKDKNKDKVKSKTGHDKEQDKSKTKDQKKNKHDKEPEKEPEKEREKEPEKEQEKEPEKDKTKDKDTRTVKITHEDTASCISDEDGNSNDNGSDSDKESSKTNTGSSSDSDSESDSDLDFKQRERRRTKTITSSRGSSSSKSPSPRCTQGPSHSSTRRDTTPEITDDVVNISDHEQAATKPTEETDNRQENDLQAIILKAIDQINTKILGNQTDQHSVVASAVLGLSQQGMVNNVHLSRVCTKLDTVSEQLTKRSNPPVDRNGDLSAKHVLGDVKAKLKVLNQHLRQEHFPITGLGNSVKEQNINTKAHHAQLTGLMNGMTTALTTFSTVMTNFTKTMEASAKKESEKQEIVTTPGESINTNR